MAVPIALVSLDCPMCAPADAIGEAVVHKTRLEDRLDDRAQCMMYDPVAKRRRRDDAFLRAIDLKCDIAARPICAAAKLPLQSEKLALKIGEERSRSRFLPLAPQFKRAASNSAAAQNDTENDETPSRNGRSCRGAPNV